VLSEAVYCCFEVVPVDEGEQYAFERPPLGVLNEVVLLEGYYQRSVLRWLCQRRGPGVGLVLPECGAHWRCQAHGVQLLD
jgi:hypothetical protein